MLFENEIGGVEKKWLTTTELAQYLGRSVGAIRNLVYRGKIQRYKFEGRIYFDKLEIDRAVSSRKGV